MKIATWTLAIAAWTLAALSVVVFILALLVAKVDHNAPFPEATRVEMDGGPVTDKQIKLNPSEYCFSKEEWISLNPGERWCEE